LGRHGTYVTSNVGARSVDHTKRKGIEETNLLITYLTGVTTHLPPRFNRGIGGQ